MNDKKMDLDKIERIKIDLKTGKVDTMRMMAS